MYEVLMVVGHSGCNINCCAGRNVGRDCVNMNACGMHLWLQNCGSNLEEISLYLIYPQKVHIEGYLRELIPVRYIIVNNG